MASDRWARAVRVAARVASAAGWLVTAAGLLGAWHYTAAFERVEPVPGVGNGPGVVARLVPCPPDQPFAFAVIGDINNLDDRGMVNFKAALRRAQEVEDVRFILLGGDLVGHPVARAYGFGLAQIRAAAPKVPTFIAPGNHDLGIKNEGKASFLRAFERDYASFEYANSLFVILNDGTYLPDADQLAWLERVLAGRGPQVRHTFALGHRPIVDYLGISAHNHLDPEEFPPLLELFERFGVDYYLCGHVHGDRRYRIGRTTHLVMGGRPKERPHDPLMALTIFRVRGERVEEEYLPIAQQGEDGSALEEFLGLRPEQWAADHWRGLAVAGVLLGAATWWGWRAGRRPAGAAGPSAPGAPGASAA